MRLLGAEFLLLSLQPLFICKISLHLIALDHLEGLGRHGADILSAHPIYSDFQLTVLRFRFISRGGVPAFAGDFSRKALTKPIVTTTQAVYSTR
jgi:hypothetical protein